MRWKAKPIKAQVDIREYSEERAMWLLRNKSEQEYRAYLKTFEGNEPETNLPKLQIFKTCPILIEAIKACSYDKKKIEDIAEFEGDDPIDGIRYMVDAAEQYFDLAGAEFKKFQKQQEHLQKLAQSNDWTAFYRNMRTLESSSSSRPVRMIHRRPH
jgi:hypothetical protein